VLASLLAAELEVLAVTVEVAPVMPVMAAAGQVTCRMFRVVEQRHAVIQTWQKKIQCR
jgi:hypothetical protein